MRSFLLSLPAALVVPSVALADFTGVRALWSDDITFAMPITDNNNTALAGGDVVQLGYFAGVDPSKSPDTYTQADWDSFIPLTGDGSANGPYFPTTIDNDFPGFFNVGATFNTDVHTDVPNTDVRVGIRVFDSPTVAGASNYNTVTASAASWIMPMPTTPDLVPPFPADADMDAANAAGTLVWEGTPFRTDLVPGVVTPDLVLTSVVQTGPTSLDISWTGGDGSNDIQTSTTGQGLATVLTNQTSPATLTIDPGGVPTLLVRVIEP